MNLFPKVVLTTLVTASAAMSIQAQVTTSAISGSVIDENKEPIIGATITAVHEPSGTLYGAITNMDGRYTIQGMRTGGPYKVEVSYVGYRKSTFTNLQLELGNTLNLNAKLQSSMEELDEVVVVADAKTQAGAAQNFSLTKITNTPTVDRNVYDVVKNMPMAMTSKNGGITFAGSNNRYNSFQIDGTVSNDVFGLSASGTNGGQTGANPISMDAIQEIQVVVAPFDVRQSGFTGGGINAITKQGTNQTHGSAYTYFNNQNMYGKYSAVRDYEKFPLSQQYTRTFGGTLGGALIKDKLFYFVSAEGKKESYPSSVYPGYTSQYITSAVARQIADKYKEYTGNSEGYDQRNVDQKSFGLLARVDWNINQDHKLAVRYQHNNSFDDNYGPGAYKYFFTNSGYRMNNKTNSIVAELNSHLSQNMYNELRASGSFIRDHRDVAYQGPTVQINDVKGADGATNITVNIGTEYSSGANSLDQDIYTFEDNLSWYLGNHTFTFGTHNEIYKMRNLFIQAVNGSWYFDGLENFLNDKPYQFSYKYTDPELTGGDYRYAPVMKAGQFGFYAQDLWRITNDFELTYGLRIDIPTVFNDPTTNPAFNEYAAKKGFDARVGEMPGAKVLFSPRVGFRWYANEDHSTLFRGGLGIFTGRVPFVWLSNAFNNTGMESKGTTITPRDPAGNYTNAAPSLAQYAKDPVGAMNSQKGSSSRPDIVTIDKDFKYPQVLRANLAIEQRLPGDVKVTLEGIYSKTMNNVFFENLALTNDGTKVYAVPGVEASAAPFYSNAKSDYYSIVNLKNTNKGYTYAFSALLEKRFNFGLDMSASYTYGRAKSVNDGTSSVAYSNWKYNYSRDTNSDKELGFSKFDVPHRIMVQASYTTPKYLNDWTSTTIAVTYSAFSGSRYSLTMNERSDFNGDGQKGNSLLYIPTNEELAKMNFVDLKSGGKVVMTAEENRAAFKNWIESDSYAKNNRGRYAERNSNSGRWEHEVNLHLGQTIYNAQGIGQLEFTFDIINFANMLNKEWGANYSSSYNLSPLSVTSISKDAQGNRTASYTYNNAEIKKSDIYSRWHAQVGIKLTF